MLQEILKQRYCENTSMRFYSEKNYPASQRNYRWIEGRRRIILTKKSLYFESDNCDESLSRSHDIITIWYAIVVSRSGLLIGLNPLEENMNPLSFGFHRSILYATNCYVMHVDTIQSKVGIFELNNIWTNPKLDQLIDTILLSWASRQ